MPLGTQPLPGHQRGAHRAPLGRLVLVGLVRELEKPRGFRWRTSPSGHPFPDRRLPQEARPGARRARQHTLCLWWLRRKASRFWSGLPSDAAEGGLPRPVGERGGHRHPAQGSLLPAVQGAGDGQVTHLRPRRGAGQRSPRACGWWRRGGEPGSEREWSCWLRSGPRDRLLLKEIPLERQIGLARESWQSAGSYQQPWSTQHKIELLL